MAEPHIEIAAKPPPRDGGNAARVRSLRGGALLVSILEGGRLRLLAGVVGDEGVKAVDRHFLRGHHHPADRRGILRGGAASSPTRARARRGRRPPRESGDGGRGGWRDKEASDASVSSPNIPRRGAFASAELSFSMDGFALCRVRLQLGNSSSKAFAPYQLHRRDKFIVAAFTETLEL